MTRKLKHRTRRKHKTQKGGMPLLVKIAPKLNSAINAVKAASEVFFPSLPEETLAELNKLRETRPKLASLNKTIISSVNKIPLLGDIIINPIIVNPIIAIAIKAHVNWNLALKCFFEKKIKLSKYKDVVMNAYKTQPKFKIFAQEIINNFNPDIIGGSSIARNSESLEDNIVKLGIHQQRSECVKNTSDILKDGVIEAVIKEFGVNSNMLGGNHKVTTAAPVTTAADPVTSKELEKIINPPQATIKKPEFPQQTKQKELMAKLEKFNYNDKIFDCRIIIIIIHMMTKLGNPFELDQSNFNRAEEKECLLYYSPIESLKKINGLGKGTLKTIKANLSQTKKSILGTGKRLYDSSDKAKQYNFENKQRSLQLNNSREEQKVKYHNLEMKGIQNKADRDVAENIRVEKKYGKHASEAHKIYVNLGLRASEAEKVAKKVSTTAAAAARDATTALKQIGTARPHANPPANPHTNPPV